MGGSLTTDANGNYWVGPAVSVGPSLPVSVSVVTGSGPSTGSLSDFLEGWSVGWGVGFIYGLGGQWSNTAQAFSILRARVVYATGRHQWRLQLLRLANGVPQIVVTPSSLPPPVYPFAAPGCRRATADYRFGRLGALLVLAPSRLCLPRQVFWSCRKRWIRACARAMVCQHIPSRCTRADCVHQRRNVH